MKAVESGHFATDDAAPADPEPLHPPLRIEFRSLVPARPVPAKRQPSSLEKYHRRIRIWYRQKCAPYWTVTVAQILCVAYVLVLTFSPAPLGMKDPVTCDIIDTNSVENTNNGVIYINRSYRAVVAIGSEFRFASTF